MALMSFVCWSPAQAPPTIEAELNKFGVPITQSGLESALKDRRPEVRSLAAGELGGMKDAASVPSIVRALEREKISLVKLNMAAALVLLDSRVGNKTLSDLCDTRSVGDDIRLAAASKLVDAGDLTCLSSVEDILQKTTLPSIKTSGLLMLAHITAMPASHVRKLHDILLASLQDPEPAVRQYASQCIADIDDKAAASELQTAIANESDDSTRQRMEQALGTLRSKP